MNTNILIKTVCEFDLLLLVSYIADNLIDNNTISEGKYPLEIASVTLDTEVSDEPWGASLSPQTRVAEKVNRDGSVWSNGDVIGVKIGEKETPAK